MGDTEQPQSISSEQLRLLNTQYFHTLRDSMNSQITGAIGRAIKKADAKIAKLEARIAQLEAEVAELKIHKPLAVTGWSFPGEGFQSALDESIQGAIQSEQKPGGILYGK